MHRGREHGLTHDREGFVLDPDERAELLHRLAKYTDNPAEQAAFAPAFLLAGDPKAMSETRIWRHVYLGRYMRLSPEQIEALPLSIIGRYISTLSELIRKEAGPSSNAETNYT